MTRNVIRCILHACSHAQIKHLDQGTNLSLLTTVNGKSSVILENAVRLRELPKTVWKNCFLVFRQFLSSATKRQLDGYLKGQQVSTFWCGEIPPLCLSKTVSSPVKQITWGGCFLALRPKHVIILYFSIECSQSTVGIFFLYKSTNIFHAFWEISGIWLIPGFTHYHFKDAMLCFTILIFIKE